MPENVWPEYRDRVAGLWKCVSFEVFNGSGADKELVAKPHGDTPLGRVQIGPNGFLTAHMAKPERMNPLPSGKAWQEGEDAEVAHVARGTSMYCGYLELLKDQEGLYWQTKVEVSTDPSWIGGLQVRRVKLVEEGGKAFMVLQPKNDMIMEVSKPVQYR